MPLLSDIDRQRRGVGTNVPIAAPPLSQRPRAEIPTRDEARGSSTLERVLDYTARPQRALVGGIRGLYKDDLGVFEGIGKGFSGKSKEGFSDILADTGLEKTGGTARYGGMVLDAVVDPLNVLPIGKIAKGIGKAGKGIAKVLRNAPLAADALDKVSNITSSAKKSNFMRGIDAFSGMDEEMKKSLRLAQAEQRTTAERVISQLLETPSRTNVPGKSALDDITQEDLAKLIGREKHEQTRRVIDEFSSKVPGRYKPDELTKFGDVEGFGPVKGIKLEPAAERVKDLKSQRSAALQGALTPVRKQQIRNQFDTQIARAEQALAAGKSGDEGLLLPKDFIENLIQDTHSKQLPKPLRRYDAVWKKMATVWNPRFHVNNFIGNLWNMGIGKKRGNTLRDNPLTAYKAGRDFLKKLEKNQLNPAESKLHEQLRRYGIDTGLTSHINYDPNDIQKVRESALKVRDQGKLFEKGMTPGKFIRRLDTKVGKAGDRSERAAKIGTVLQELKAGKSVEDAMLHAKDVLFDYQELTPEMRAIRNYIAPFWTFKLKNTPLQIAGAAKHPAWFAQVGKAKQNLGQAAMEDGTFVPERERYEDDVFNGMMSLPAQIGETKIGLRNTLPVADMNILEAWNTDTRAGQNAIEQQADAINPLWQALGRTLFDVDIRRPGNLPKPPEGIFGPVTGNPLLQTAGAAARNLETAARGASSIPGYKNRMNKDATEIRVPFLVNEILNQNPLANTIGRIGMPITNPELGGDPLAALAWFGVPAVGTTAQTRKRAKLTNDREYGRLKNRLKRNVKERR